MSFVYIPYRYMPGDTKRDYPTNAQVLDGVVFNNGTQEGTLTTTGIFQLPLEVIDITTPVEVIEI